MGYYEGFNQIETLEEFIEWVKNISYQNLTEVCEKIMEDYGMSDYNLTENQYEGLNSYAIQIAEDAIKFNSILCDEIPIKENFLEISEAITAGHFYIMYKSNGNNQFKEEKFSENDFFYHRWKFVTSSLRFNNTDGRFGDIKKRQVILLSKYIKNNVTKLRIKITPRLIPIYILEKQQKIQRDIESLIAKSNETIQESNSRIDDIEPQLNEAKESIKKIKPIIKKSERKIKNINNNMITIMALFLTAFSIVGINIYSLNNALGIQEILLVNSSLVFVLSILMYMLDIIINDEKLRLLIVVGIAAVFLCGVLYFNNDLPKVNEVEQSPTQSIEVQTNLSTAN